MLLNTAEGRAWRKNVARDPRVTVTVANNANPYEYVSVTGTVVEDTHNGADQHINRMAKKYVDQDGEPGIAGASRKGFRRHAHPERPSLADAPLAAPRPRSRPDRASATAVVSAASP